MIKKISSLVLLIISLGCTQEPKISGFSDDYVLIEFAARLEEEKPQIYSQPLVKHNQMPPK